jgi:hypothetical protein
MVDPMSVEVLEANAEDVIEAVIEHGAEIALGPALAVNPHECAIKLRFDILTSDDAAIYREISKVIEIILRETDLVLVKSEVETQEESDDAATGEFAAA